MRSLIEPPGFCDSSLSSSVHGPVSKRVTSTSGVLPISSRTAGARVADINGGQMCSLPGAVYTDREIR